MHRLRLGILWGTVCLLAACQAPAASAEEGEPMTIKMQLSGQTFSVALADTAAARAWAKRLPVTLQMQELNGNEKYAYLSKSLPSAPQAVGDIRAGDIMLFGDDCLVLFYASFHTPYRYTRIGRVEHLPDLSGPQAVSVTFSN